MNDSILNQPISQISSKLSNKDISPVELTNLALQRAHQINKLINCYITINDKLSLKQAQAAEKKINLGTADLLTGIPFCMKDAYVTKDLTTTCSSNVLKNYIPQYSATVYERLRQQDAIIIGKNNHDAWGHGGSNENTDFGVTKNPWDITRTPGGSSGGTAAAISAGTSVFGIAEDTGGSIRNPSSFNNNTGLKVTYGRVSRYGSIAYASSLDSVGPIGNSVEDIALVMEVIAGHDPKDASSSKKKVPKYSSQLKKSLKGIKIGIVKEYMDKSLDPSVLKAVNEMRKVFKDLGVKFKEVSIPLSKKAHSIYYLISFSETSSNLARYDGIRYGEERRNFSAETMRRIMMGSFALSSGYYDEYYNQALKARTRLIKEYDTAFSNVDAIIAPVMPFPPYKFGQLGSHENYVIALYLADIYTCVANVVGIPGLSLPSGFTKDNLPIGLQLLAPQFREDLLLNLGYQFQQNTNWHLKKPLIIKK